MSQVGVDEISQVQGASRVAKSYAFLQATFARTSVSNSPIRDALECLVPFISPHLQKYPGRQIDLTALQEFLRFTFGLAVPLYALQQLLPSLCKMGLAEYRKTSRIYVAKGRPEIDKFTLAKEEIETEFEDITNRIQLYADDLEASIVPPSGTWGDALINFLKSNSPAKTPNFISIKGAMINPQVVETAIVAGYVRDAHYKEPHYFQIILKIFMGILIEDLIATISGVGPRAQLKELIVLYDTHVLMRTLGMCGGLLKVATIEMTRYLQDIGAQTMYLAGNEEEALGIIDAIVTKKQTGDEVFGETADALANQEVTFHDLQTLQATFSTELARLNIFPAGDLEKYDPKLNQYQIDEQDFADYLASRALQAGRTYSDRNRENDASYLAHVVRLRRGMRTRDFADSRCVFVTANFLLASTARRYLVKTRVHRDYDCPVILNVGQVSTIAWLLKDGRIQIDSAGRELLANCYAAIQPDASWFQAFREAIQKTVGDLETYAKDAKNSLVLRAARRIAKDASFGNAVIMRNLSTVEIIEQSNRSAEQEIERIRLEEKRRSEDLIDKLLADQRTGIYRGLAQRAATFIRSSVGIVACIVLILFAALYDTTALFAPHNIMVMFLQLIFLIPTVLGMLDLLGFPVVKKLFARLETAVFLGVLALLMRFGSDSTQPKT